MGVAWTSDRGHVTVERFLIGVCAFALLMAPFVLWGWYEKWSESPEQAAKREHARRTRMVADSRREDSFFRGDYDATDPEMKRLEKFYAEHPDLYDAGLRRRAQQQRDLDDFNERFYKRHPEFRHNTEPEP